MKNLLNITEEQLCKVRQIRQITKAAYVLRFDRNDRGFTAGQHVILGLKDQNNAREYSVYSGENDDYFEILVKEVLNGTVSKQLKQLRSGAVLQMDGPMGTFTLPAETIRYKKVIFIATGTGIAPFRSMVRSYPELDYLLLHGVRYAVEAYDRNEYQKEKYVLCTTADQKGDFRGRVTDYLMEHIPDPNAEFYLCGNTKMIHDAFDILTLKGVKPEQLHTEAYF
ncbi:MAG TPA: FAD-binding oxidoreductase [Bacteroidales bacterium]|nr:FAD-binding oxidoreductase [Bacteroidales bacterium]